MTARDVKDALRRRHPTDQNRGGMVGEWTCIEEWLGIDLLALSAWNKAHVVGYEVKVSRSDMRRELLRPDKRADAVSRTTEFYFAVPDGLFTDDELAFIEPDWGDDDFERARCPGIPPFGGPGRRFSNEAHRFGGQCWPYRRYGHGGAPYRVRVPVPCVFDLSAYDVQRRLDESDAVWEGHVASALRHEITHRSEADVECPTCGGKGYVERSRVEAEAPTLWVPRDVGLVIVTARGCRVAKKAPRRKDPKPIATTRKQINDLVRWVSHRPDERHILTRNPAPIACEDAA